VLYADDDLVVVNKPAGLPSHPLRAGEGPSAAGALVVAFPSARSPRPIPGKEGWSSDWIAAPLACWWPRAARGLARPAHALAAPDCEKTYLAEVVGCFPDVGAGEKDFVSPGARPGTLSVAVPIAALAVADRG